MASKAHALDAYRRKRNFIETSEPRGAKSRGSEGWLFVVQKHAARRLHYDFRLELDGVLKSWAVTRGPSLKLGEKRLAVHVEDHPLDYGEFEGKIPEGNYGAGSVLLWDRGQWEPIGDPRAGYAKGHLSFKLHGEKLRGGWNLIRMRPRKGERGDNWLLIKSRDDEGRGEKERDVLEEEPGSVKTGRSIEEIAKDPKSGVWRSGKDAAAFPPPAAQRSPTPRQRAAAPVEAAGRGARKSTAVDARKSSARLKPFRFSPPHGARKGGAIGFVAPELASLVARPPEGPWLHEIKFDGYRLQAARDGATVVLSTRKGLDWTAKFPSVAEAVRALPAGNLILDGEVVCETEAGLSDFGGLQAALTAGDTNPIKYYAFDLLHLDGYDLRGVALGERKAALERLLAASASTVLRYCEHFEDSGEWMLTRICKLGGEGVVSKRKASLYASGRTKDWLKSKCSGRQELVVVGYAPSSAMKRAVGSLALGYWEKDALIYAGRVGTGFSHRVAVDLFAQLERIGIDQPALTTKLLAADARGLRWVRPERVAEIEFRGWTKEGQLRQASFKGLRDDKSARDVVRERPADDATEPTAQPRGKTSSLTHPDRVLWPDVGVTKQGLADYYAAVWPWMEPFVVRRPLALVRCPSGADHACFFQKHAWRGMDDAVLRIDDPNEKDAIVAIEDLSGLTALVQAAALEIHPWGARIDDLDRPDMVVFDLDPGEGVAWLKLCDGARAVRDRLEEYGLRSFLKTSGGKGLHVVAPVRPAVGWPQVKAFCKSLAEDMARDAPSEFVSKMTKSVRSGRIYIDYLRNTRGATAAAAYSTRARPGCPVSTPLSWEEADEIGGAARFTVSNAPSRLVHLSRDPWADFFKLDQSLPAAKGSSGPPKTRFPKPRLSRVRSRRS